VRLALRRLIRHRGFSIPTISTLALGLGTAAVVFVLLHTVVLRPLPYPDADHLVRLRSFVPGVGGAEWNVAKAEFLYFSRESKTLDGGGLYMIDRAPVTVGSGLAVDVGVAVASAGVAPVLGARVALGRLLRESDGLGATNPVVVLTDGFWRSFFGGDPGVIGRTLRLNGTPFEVVGVMEPGVKLPEELEGVGVGRIDIWVPLRLDPAEAPQNSHVFNAIARLAAGASLAAAQTELAQLTTKLPEVLPQAYRPKFMSKTGFTTRVTLLRDDIMGGMDRVLWILFGAGLLVLAVAAANTTNLFLARFETRRRRAGGPGGARRGARGAGTTPPHRGSAARTGVGNTGAGARGRWSPTLRCTRARGIAEGGGSETLGDGGDVHALRRGDLRRRCGSPSAGPRRSVGSIFGRRDPRYARAGAASRSSRAGGGADGAVADPAGGRGAAGAKLEPFARNQPGIRPDQRGDLHGGAAEESVWGSGGRFTVLPRPGSVAQGLPGVQSAGLASTVPLSGFDGCNAMEPEGLGEEVCMAVVLATPGYLGTLGIPLRGDLPSRTAAGRANVVVNEAMAKRHWAGREAIGRWISQTGE
jgi:hypothetical protein